MLRSQIEVLGPRPHVRAFTVVILGALAVCLPLEAHYRPSEAFLSLLPIYLACVVLGVVGLIASHTALGTRHADRLALLLVLGQAADVLLYLSVSPGHPGLVADALTFLLVAGTILFSDVKAFAERHGIAAMFATAGLPVRLPAEIETAVYRIAQEALTNVARHARAAHVHVALRVRDGELRLDVEDDGVGLRRPGPGDHPGGTGLTGIRERVLALGGRVAISSARGTWLRVWLPVPAAADSALEPSPVLRLAAGSGSRGR